MNKRIQDLTKTALFAAVISISAYIRIPTTLVPLTFQSVAVLITGYCLGPRYGAFATILYTAVGLAGLPVFASGGGPVYFFSPTFGYIIGFTFCAMITGYLARFNVKGTILKAYLIMLAGLIGIYIPGILWFILSLNWIAGIPGDIITILKISLLIPLAGDLITTIPAAIVAVKIRKNISRTG
ncbi:biotin transporter BioY [Candidatus Latescibacterota bacterium]